MNHVTEIKNDKGDYIALTNQEHNVALRNQEVVNALGFEVNITSLTAIVKSVTEQKFYQIKPSNYLPVRVGEGAWSSNMLTYRSFELGTDFETGNINTGGSNSRLAETNAGIDSITVPVINWAKQISWSLFDLQLASRSGSWDLITAKEKSRKTNWDLGIQRIAFLGSRANSTVKGLYTQSDVTSNTALITAKLSTMSSANFNTFLQSVLAAYQTNNAYTAYPTHFIIPQDDYNGLAAPSTDAFPIISKLQLLEDTFKTITQNPNFKILPNSYGVKINNADVFNLNRYILLRYDADSVRMDIPVDYTSTVANSINNFQYQNAAYGQYTGVKAYRPLEMLYFDYA